MEKDNGQESFCAQSSRPSPNLTLGDDLCIAELTLAPSGDEILPVRYQKLADQCLYE